MIGYGLNVTAAEADTFKSLTDANALNFQKTKAQTYLCRDRITVQSMLDSLANFLKGVPEKC
jgi:hypothetical protein